MNFSIQVRFDTMQWIDKNNGTEEIVIYNVTSLRIDPDYMYYYIHWTRSASLLLFTISSLTLTIILLLCYSTTLLVSYSPTLLVS